MVSLRRNWCAALTILKLHRPDCEHCNLMDECRGAYMRKRLQQLCQEALDARSQPAETGKKMPQDAA